MTTYQRVLINHTDITDSSTVTLTDMYDIDTQEGIEASMDTFQFRLLLGVKPSRTFEINDGIDIYMGDGSDDPTTLVINGIITELNYELSVDGMLITISGVNRVERLLFSPRPALYNKEFTHTDANDVARTGWDAIITHLIDKANDYKSSQDSTNITYDIDSIPELGDLDDNYHTDWKSIYEHLETLATDEWAPDGVNYIIELDTSNKLHLRSKDSSTYSVPAGTIDLDGVDVISTKVTYGLYDVVNAILINCGQDSNGNSVFVARWDSTSMGQHGAKYKYIKQEELANSYYRDNEDYGKDIETQREDIKKKGKKKAAEVLTLFANPRYKVNADFIGTTSYVRGKVYWVTSSEITPLAFSPGRKLRLKNITHRFVMNGWSTRLQLEEDEETIEGYA